MALLECLEFFITKFKHNWLVPIAQQLRLIALVDHSEPKRSARLYLALIRHPSHREVELGSLFRASCVRQGVWTDPQIVAVELILRRCEQRRNIVFIVLLFLSIRHGVVVFACIARIIRVIDSLTFLFLFLLDLWNDVLLSRKKVLALPEIARFKFTRYPHSILKDERVSVRKGLPPHWIILERWL